MSIDVGPFSSVADVSTGDAGPAVARLLDAALAQGATRVALVAVDDAAPWRGRHAPGLGGADLLRSADGSLHGALTRMIDQVELELGGKLPELSREDKQRAVRLLDERGAFLLRRSVEDVADALGVSRITVYNYLNAIRA